LTAASATFALKAGVWFRRARLLIVSPDSRVNLARRQAETPLIALSRFPEPALEKHRLPICYPYRDYVDLGGLMAYAPDLSELARRLADNVHQILNGAKAGDIPVYQPSKFQLVFNLKAAKSLGLTTSPAMSARADEMIE
jgi:hypothetical protein